MVKFQLENGMWVFIDDHDWPLVSQYHWRLNKEWYVYANIKGRPVGIHKLIMNPPEGMVVDHWNGNSLDNLRSNLRIATREQNGWNKPKYNGKYRGVLAGAAGTFKCVLAGGYAGRVSGLATEAEAARMWDGLAINKRGEFTQLNFPNGYENILPDRIIKACQTAKISPFPCPGDYFQKS